MIATTALTSAFAAPLPAPRPCTPRPALPARGTPRAGTDEPGRVRSPVNRAVTGVAAGTVTAARFAGHFVAACVSVAFLGDDADV
jgi:hypothetical protein